MIYGWEESGLGLLNYIITASLVFIWFLIMFITMTRFVKKSLPFIFSIASLIILETALVFNMMPLFYSCIALSTGGYATVILANVTDFKEFIHNPKRRKNKAGIERIFDREAFYNQIETAVLSLSKTKTGALITFERENSLQEYIRNGVAVHAPVKAELLTTIFYPGTRLHDGAVIIKNDEIKAASVFYTPTTKAFGTKFGSRHRAAIGISEVSDSVTVVVSEETGRISIAVNGELESVDANKFLRVFETYMGDEELEED